jgi:hypothetical protein
MQKLKYFTESGNEPGKEILLQQRILSISKESGNIIIREQCDGYFYEEYSKQEAIELLQEAIDWIKTPDGYS